MKKTLGIAIPVGEKDLDRVKYLLDSIEHSTILPKSVSLSIPKIPKNLYEKTYSYDIIFTETKESFSASKNRNIAASKLSTDIISFVDADDIVHPQRNELLLISFENSKVVVHDYHQTSYLDENFLSTKYENPEILFDYIDTPSVNKITLFPVSSKGHLPYHCGHVSVLSETFNQVKYDESFVVAGEDGDFLNRVSKKNILITYINNKLTNYIK